MVLFPKLEQIEVDKRLKREFYLITLHAVNQREMRSRFTLVRPWVIRALPKNSKKHLILFFLSRS